jgi:NAD(P)-dependent dehydrogenase (short-subunit alcohol dehydrogenase family)
MARIVVTGGASGIGRAAVEHFVAQGHAVVALDRNEALLSDCPTDWRAVDVRDGSAFASAMPWAAEKLGGLDTLISCAGVPSRGAITDVSEQEWDRVFDINVKGLYLAAKHAIPHMRAGGGGRIVNVASQLGLVAAAGSAAYCASKGAAIQLTRAMALDHAAEGIRVNCVCPGPTDTPLADAYFAASADPEAERRDYSAQQLHERLIDPSEVVAAIAFLASDQATSVIGAALVVDAGYTIR